MGIDNAMRHRYALKERGDDFYETPAVATLALLRHQPLPRRIWEPACGKGAISSVLAAAGHEVVSTDLVDYGFSGAASGRDFLMEQRGAALAAPQREELSQTERSEASATARPQRCAAVAAQQREEL